MFFLRTTRTANVVRSFARETTATSSLRATTASIGRRFASQDYGSGEQSSASVDKEHPGPPPPKTAQSQGNRQEVTPDSSSSSKQSQSSGQQSQSKSNGSQPKILSDSPPKEGEEPEEVRKHNEEMKNRADKAHESVKDKDLEKDKVGKGFWSGTGGRDGDA